MTRYPESRLIADFLEHLLERNHETIDLAAVQADDITGNTGRLLTVAHQVDTLIAHEEEVMLSQVDLAPERSRRVVICDVCHTVAPLSPTPFARLPAVTVRCRAPGSPLIFALDTRPEIGGLLPGCARAPLASEGRVARSVRLGSREIKFSLRDFCGNYVYTSNIYPKFGCTENEPDP